MKKTKMSTAENTLLKILTIPLKWLVSYLMVLQHREGCLLK